MNSRVMMSLSAGVMGLLGMAATFLPHEIIQYLGAEATGALPLLVQLLGALYLGFGLLNWMAKGVLIGGIYARPLALGNFMHFFVGAMALLKATVAIPSATSVGWACTAVFGVFAVLFGLICFRHPLKQTN